MRCSFCLRGSSRSRRLRDDDHHRIPTIVYISIAALLGLALVALFYAPFFQSSYLDRTSSYLARRSAVTS
jgi:hypothetical protein